MTNLYLYGSVYIPESKIHSGDTVVIHMDTTEYMTDGAGRYAHISDSPLVQGFPTNNAGGVYIDIPDGEYTASDLRSEGYTGKSSSFDFVQYDIDKDSSDYGQRVYIYNSTSFKIADNTIFVVENGQRYLKDASILAFDDNFDFESGSLLAQAGNKFILKPEIDPNGAGKKVGIVYGGKENVSTIDKYDLSDFDSDLTKSSNENSGNFYSAYKAMEVLKEGLVDGGSISPPNPTNNDLLNFNTSLSSTSNNATADDGDFVNGTVISGGDYTVSIPSLTLNENGLINNVMSGTASDVFRPGAFTLADTNLITTFNNTIRQINSDPVSTALNNHFAGLTTLHYQAPNVQNIDHLVLDLNDNGVELISFADSNVPFDVDNDGKVERTGWVDGNDEMLVHDKDGDGIINDITETISEYYQLDDVSKGEANAHWVVNEEGKYSNDGLDALRKLDSNQDGKFSNQDLMWNGLQVWQDADEDGFFALKKCAQTHIFSKKSQQGACDSVAGVSRLEEKRTKATKRVATNSFLRKLKTDSVCFLSSK
jgi:hypothetical protein